MYLFSILFPHIFINSHLFSYLPVYPVISNGIIYFLTFIYLFPILFIYFLYLFIYLLFYFILIFSESVLYRYPEH